MARTAVIAGIAILSLAVTTAPASAGDWLSPFDLAEPGASLPVDEPLVAMAPGGDATVVWLQEGDCASGTCTEVQVMARQVRADGSRGAVRRLTTPNATPDTPDDAESPQLAVDSAGRACVVWLRPDVDGNVRVQMTMLDAAGAPDNVATLTPPGQSFDAVGLGLNDAGQGVLVSVDHDRVEARRLDTGTGAVGNPTMLRPLNGHSHDSPAVVVDAAGVATVAWNDFKIGSNPETTTVEARRLGLTGPPGTLHTLDTWPQAIADPIAIDVQPASGRVTILWSHFPAAGFAPESVNGAHITATDALGPFPLPVSFDEAGHPDVAVGPDGNALAVFDIRLQPLSLTKNVIAKRIAPDGTASGFLFLSDNGFDAIEPQVDLAPDGTAFVGWHEVSPGRRVMAARIPAGAQPEDAEPLAVGVGAGSTAAVVADRDGSALAAFTRTAAGEDVARAVHFDGEGPLISTFGLPGRGFVTQELWFGAVIRDELSPLAPPDWTFGDGTSGSEPVLSHAFRRPGTFPVTLQLADATGNTTSRSGSVVISSLPQAPPPVDARPATPSFTVGGLPGRVQRRTLLRRGLAVRVTAQAPTAFAVELLGRLRGARLTALGDIVLAERQLNAAAGTHTARLRVSRALRGVVRRGARLKVRITATDAGGRTTALTRRVRVR
jgi:hypothetical protein